METITKEQYEELKRLFEEIHQHLSVQDAKLNHIVRILEEKK